jgi:hypothetical protein
MTRNVPEGRASIKPTIALANINGGQLRSKAPTPVLGASTLVERKLQASL